jgi:hypothetical protein
MLYSLVPLVEGPKYRGRTMRVPEGYDRQAVRNWLIFGDMALMRHADPLSGSKIVKVAEGDDELLATAARTAFDKLGAGFELKSTDSFRQLPARLLFSGRFGSFLPSKKRQQYEIRFGTELFWSQKVYVPPSTKTYVDNFSGTGGIDGRTSSDSLFSWQLVYGPDPAVSGGRVSAVDTFVGVCSASVDTDQSYGYVDLVSFNNADPNSLFFIDIAVDATAIDGYEFAHFPGHAPLSYFLSEAYTVLDEPLVTREAARYVLSRDGSSITVTKDGELFASATNTSIPANSTHRRAALGGGSDVGASTVVLDNWGYGDIIFGTAEVAGFRFFNDDGTET